MFLDHDLRLGIWENEGGRTKAAVRPRLPPGLSHRGAHGGVPRFVNDVGARTVAIGVTALNCIGATPPADHPHVYLEMGEGADILCPYCATLFCFHPALRFDETLPPGCFHDAGAGAPALASPAFRREEMT
jgi:uncharacterized Zn-finger protein